MKTTFSSSILNAQTAGRARPRQMKEMHRGLPWLALGRRWAEGAVRAGLSAGRRVRLRGMAAVVPAVPAQGGASTAARGKPQRSDSAGVLRWRSAGREGAPAMPGVRVKASAGAACAAGVPCGVAALPYAPATRRGAGGRGAAMDGREGRRRITFWALPRCGASWGFA